MKLDKLNNISVPEELNEIKKTVYKKKKSKRYFRNIVITSLILFLFGFTMPSYTKDLPVYSQIFNLFGMENYQEESTGINKEITKKGVTISIIDAVYSGDDVAITYQLKSDKFTGEEELNFHPYINLRDVKISGGGGESGLEYIGENTYIGYLRMVFHSKEKLKDSLVADLSINKIEDLKTNKEIKANWEFSFPIERLDNETIDNDIVIEHDGYFAKINELLIDNLGIKYKVKFWNEKDVLMRDFYAEDAYLLDKDNNKIELEVSGGSAGDNSSEFLWTGEHLPKGEYKILVDLISLERGVEGGFETDENGEVVEIDEEEIKEMREKEEERFKTLPESIRFEIPFIIE